jgi:hypothetical protein
MPPAIFVGHAEVLRSRNARHFTILSTAHIVKTFFCVKVFGSPKDKYA